MDRGPLRVPAFGALAEDLVDFVGWGLYAVTSHICLLGSASEEFSPWALCHVVHGVLYVKVLHECKDPKFPSRPLNCNETNIVIHFTCQRFSHNTNSKQTH